MIEILTYVGIAFSAQNKPVINGPGFGSCFLGYSVYTCSPPSPALFCFCFVDLSRTLMPFHQLLMGS
jgi:hypothetical protein